MTIREIAKIAQVSPAAVSIALNNKKGVSDKTRAHVLKVVKENDYNRSKKMKDVLLFKFWSSGMLVEENQSFVHTIVDAIGDELRLHNYRLTMHVGKNSLEEALREVTFDHFCAAIVIGTEITRELFPILDNIPIPYVMVDNAALGVNCNSICMDNSSNVYKALAYLKEMGHRQIGYLRSSTRSEAFTERFEAFHKWAEVLQFDIFKEAEFFLTPTLVGAYKDMYEELNKGTRMLPSCLYADNDTIAIGAIKALKECGYSLPKDVSIIGMDDIPFSSVSSPTLTTVRVQKEVIGQIAVTQLLALLDDSSYQDVKTRVIGELIVRSSVSDLRR